MRITANMLVQQLSQALRAEGGGKVPPGTVLTARVMETLNGTLLLDLGDGQPVTARDQSGGTFLPGQTVVFEAVGRDEAGALQVRALTQEAVQEQGTDDAAIGQLMKRLNLPDTPVNRELIRALAAYQIPLNTDNVRAAQELTLQARGILQMTAESGAAPLADSGGEPLKQVALKLIAATEGNEAAVSDRAAAQKGSTPVQKEGIPAVPAGTVPADAPQPAIKPESATAAVPANIQRLMEALASQTGDEHAETAPAAGSPRQEPPVAVTPSPEKPALEPGQGLKNTAPAVAGTDPEGAAQRGDALRAVLKELTPEKVGFVLKHQLPASLNTLDTIDKMILGKRELGQQLRSLMDLLPQDDAGVGIKTAVTQALKAVRITADLNPFELKDQLKTLNEALSALGSETTAKSTASAPIREALGEVRQSIDFLSRLSENATFLHIPVNLGQGEKKMELYVQRDRSGQKKVNPRDTRIFISLDTDHLDTVQCLVEVKDKRLNLSFRVADDEALAAVSEYFEPLKETLKALDFTDVHVNGTVSRQPLTLLDVTQSAPEAGRLDMRV